jgi:hypothetical protein
MKDDCCEQVSQYIPFRSLATTVHFQRLTFEGESPKWIGAPESRPSDIEVRLKTGLGRACAAKTATYRLRREPMSF